MPTPAPAPTPTLDNLFRTVLIGLTNIDGMTKTDKAQHAVDAVRLIQNQHAALKAQNAELAATLQQTLDALCNETYGHESEWIKEVKEDAKRALQALASAQEVKP